MKKILEISLREDGLAMVGCELENEIDCKRLGAAFMVLAHKDFLFRAALLAAADTLREHPDAGELIELSEKTAAARMFMSTNPKKGN